MRILIARTDSFDNYATALKNLGVEYECRLDDIDVNQYDGVIMPGGADINPARYNEEVKYDNVFYNDEMDEKQFKILDQFVKAEKPVLGICRGMQLINVYFGGTLYQDITNHRLDIEHETYHQVCTEKGNFLYDNYGECCTVNSSHHQAVNILADNFTVMQKAEDGTVEAVSHNYLPVIAVQYHPERMCFESRNEKTIDGKFIFQYFLNMKRAS